MNNSVQPTFWCLKRAERLKHQFIHILLMPFSPDNYTVCIKYSPLHTIKNLLNCMRNLFFMRLQITENHQLVYSSLLGEDKTRPVRNAAASNKFLFSTVTNVLLRWHYTNLLSVMREMNRKTDLFNHIVSYTSGHNQSAN